MSGTRHTKVRYPLKCIDLHVRGVTGNLSQKRDMMTHHKSLQERPRSNLHRDISRVKGWNRSGDTTEVFH